MAGLLESVKEHFDTTNLYEALGVDKHADEAVLKRAYRRLSLRVHPDRVPSDEVAVATTRFQVLGKIYSILSDKNRRAVYDDTGSVDEEDSELFSRDMNWMDYFNTLFKLTSQDIKDFCVKFKNSEDEADELRTAYLEHDGDMDRIMEEVTMATIDDEPRFTEMLNGWIKAGKVPALSLFTRESVRKKKQRKRRYEQEAAEAEEMQREMNSNGADSLKQIIQARQESREKQMGAFFDQLEEKYAKKPKKKGKASSSSKGKNTPSSSSSSSSSSRGRRQQKGASPRKKQVDS